MTSARWPKPGINRDTQFFWDGLQAGQLLIQRCTGCGRLRHPPGAACPHCHSLAWDTVAASGRGVIHSFVRMHHPHVPVFDKPNPIGLIDLEEGTRLVARLIGFVPEAIVIGAAVELVIRECEPGLFLPLFRPAAAEGETA